MFERVRVCCFCCEWKRRERGEVSEARGVRERDERTGVRVCFCFCCERKRRERGEVSEARGVRERGEKTK